MPSPFKTVKSTWSPVTWQTPLPHCVRLFTIQWIEALQASLSLTISWSLLRFVSIESVMPSNHLTHPLSFSSSLNPSQHQGLFQWSSLHIRWPKYWSFSICPSNAYSGLISFKTDWFFSLLSKNSQESSLAPQFKSINSSVPCHLYCAALTSVRDYCKDHSLD